MRDEWDDDEFEDLDDVDEAALDALDVALPRALRRTGADKAVLPTFETGDNILDRMRIRDRRRRGRQQHEVISPEQGIHVGPQQRRHPDNHEPGFGRADGAYLSRTGRYGISLEVERRATDADDELTKHRKAMATALDRRAAHRTPRGGRTPQPYIRANDVRNSATIAVEVDRNDARRIRRVRQQTFSVPTPGRVRGHVRITYQAAPGSRGITVAQAQRMGLLDVIRTPTPSRPNPRLRRHPSGGRVLRGGSRHFDALLEDDSLDELEELAELELEDAG